MIFEYHLETAWSAFEATAKGSTAFGSTISGGSVSDGRAAMPSTWKSPTTTDEENEMARSAHAPIHPGEILLEEFLEPLELSQYRLAKDIGVPARRINEIVHGKRGITADTALRLARYFETTDRFWMNLQIHYDLEVEKRKLRGRLAKEVTARKAG